MEESASGIRAEIVRQGNWLFRWRSYLPIVLLGPFAVAVATMRWPLGSYRLHEFWEFSCLGISILGLVIRSLVIGFAPGGTSCRATQRQVAECLNTTGMYSLVRHPLYLGNFLIWFGIALIPLNIWFASFFVLAFWLYYERIAAAEENFLRLKFGTAFDDWAATTPSFVPRFRGWQQPPLKFSWRNVLKREYTALGGLIAGHFAVELVEHLVIDARVTQEWFWYGLAIAGVVLYFTLRTIRLRTKLLHVGGR